MQFLTTKGQVIPIHVPPESQPLPRRRPTPRTVTPDAARTGAGIGNAVLDVLRHAGKRQSLGLAGLAGYGLRRRKA